MDKIPNILSLSRVPLGFLIIILYSNTEQSIFFWVLTFIGIAVITDILDGKIARKFQCESNVGYILDGLGDRIVYISCFMGFLSVGQLSAVVVWLIVIKEVAVYAIRLMETNWQGETGFSRQISLAYALFIRLLILSHLCLTACHLWFEGYIATLSMLIIPLTVITLFISYLQLYVIIKRIE